MKLKFYFPIRAGLLSVSALFIVIVTRGQDIPVAVPNLEVIPAGSIVIPMDNTHQVTTSGMFNLKAYGFVIDLINHSFPVKWVIRSGKLHDGIDFTATAERMMPTYLASQSRDFRSGPFVILPADTAGIFSHLQNMNDTLPAAQQVSLYRLTQSVTVDVRYNLTKSPKVAILDDGTFSQIHINYMQYASVPAVNYSISYAANLVKDCYTIATEPHVDSDGGYVDSVRTFLLAGGNFLAQCHAVQAYENSLNGHFHTTGGITRNNVNAQPTTIYPNADMAFGQFNGSYTPYQDGNTRLWQNVVGSFNQNNCYSVVGNSLYPGLTGASVSKMKAGLGGVVFYVGNHEFDNLNDIGEVNGIRMYLNAILVPSATDCNYAIWNLLPVKLESFDASKKTESSATINWEVSQEEEGTIYYLEQSTDGRNFSVLYTTQSSGSNSSESYAYNHQSINTEVVFYRLKIKNAEGTISYSEIRRLQFGSKKGAMSVYPNPAVNDASLLLGINDGERLQIKIHDATGRIVKQNFVIVNGQRAQLDLNGLTKGLYWIVATTNLGEQYKSKLLISQ